jgi:hypothetical protein
MASTRQVLHPVPAPCQLTGSAGSDLPAKLIHCITQKQYFGVLVERGALVQQGLGVWRELR